MIGCCFYGREREGKGRRGGRRRRRRRKRRRKERKKRKKRRHKTQLTTKRLSIPHSAQLNTRKIKHRLPSPPPPPPSLLPPYPLNTTTQHNTTSHRHFLHNNNPNLHNPPLSPLPCLTCNLPPPPPPTIPHPIPKLETTTVRVSYPCDFQ